MRAASVAARCIASTDGTAEVAQSFGDRVIYVRQDNAGPIVARNHGVERSTGDFICFLDCDDVWEPEKTAKQLEAFRNDDSIGFSFTFAQNFWEEEMREEEEQFKDHPRSKPLAGVVTTTLLTPRRVFDAVGPFDPKLTHSDCADWVTRAEAAGFVKHIHPDVLIRRRLHKENLSRKGATDSREEFLKLIKAQLDAKRAAAEAE